MDYRQTLQLPRTSFAMKANLTQREPERLAAWEREQWYQRLLESRRQADAPLWVLHDGPPYANGHIHLGHLVNKVLKDFVIRTRAMEGYLAPYVPGWDTHGLPIEQQVIKDLGVDRHALSPLEFRRRCREYALRYVDIQRREFQRLGVWGDWDHPYLTLAPEYEANQVEVFGRMAKAGYIYKGLKSVFWCGDCETALAEAEIEYHDQRSPSIYVSFPLVDDQGKLGALGAHLSILIWTTTPWTIPANVAVALHPDLQYVRVESPRGPVLMAAGLVEQVAQALGWESPQVLGGWAGRELEGITYRHPLFDRTCPVVLGEHVTLEAGTGCVHTAPGHGPEDFEIGERYGLPILSPVNAQGRFTAEAGPYVGKTLSEGNKLVIQDLDQAGHLFHVAWISHQYPHCWRCKNPILFRATEQWFASVEGFRQQALQAIDRVTWIPKWGRDRIHHMVADRSDWCISRQRVWGVPIPIFYCEGCEAPLITDESIAAVADLFRKEGSDAWWTHSAAQILPAGTVCPECRHDRFRKEQDIMDVWFDSGSSHATVLTEQFGLRWPADMYLEGSDQHRGWFQSSLLTAVATVGEAPYRSVLTHGFTVDAEGRKMSKSVGNVITPEEVMQRYGADILRLWVASADYRGDLRVSNEILEQIAEVYRRIRNTARFLLGNVTDFDAARDAVPYERMFEIDRWALLRLQRLVERVTKAYAEYEYHAVYQAVHHFCSVDLGGFYLDVLKDRLYCSAADSIERRSAQTALTEILVALTKLIAPILVFTADEIWDHLPQREDVPCVHLTTWPKVRTDWVDRALEARWERFFSIRRLVTRALEQARSERLIGGSTEAALTLTAARDVAAFLRTFGAHLADLFMVSTVAVHEADELAAESVDVSVQRATGEKCERCWRYAESVGRHADHPTLCDRCTHVIMLARAER